MLDKAKSLTTLPAVDPALVANRRFLILHTRWNDAIVNALRDGALNTLTGKYGVPRANIDIVTVPGSYELPFATQSLLQQAKAKHSPYAAAIPIGVLIKGSTMHFEYICDAVSQGLMKVGLEERTPVIFGVLTCLTDEQAHLRAGIPVGDDKGHNHGIDWAAAAVEMALLDSGNAKIE
ncbi:6,7-dimethyl-8-ribityllumazine synthase [Catenaria anguillulae PL171]|uniref:6,7-dimethyl-8-ribityllumazine synthase n=1 Tax=Catenaria anguillulae PL171 TaxID=765915 RepID=A0A1Y2HTL3_9FUNG|nr:6,7-dimethyl-8-ribityllumazine synthase [Catenaria anguillulae PL171]